MKINLSLPIYHTIEFKRPKTVKTKKGSKLKYSKTFLVGMNWYRNVHFHEETLVKSHYHKLVLNSLEALKGKKSSKYTINYKLFHKSKVCDAMNIISVIDKYFNDALQEAVIVIDDNVNNYAFGSWSVGGLDKDNPRIEIELELLDV